MNAGNKSSSDDVINASATSAMKSVKRDEAGKWTAPILAPKPFCLKSHVTDRRRDFRIKTKLKESVKEDEDEDWFRDIPLPPSNLCPSEKSLCSRLNESRCITAVQSSGTTRELMSLPPLPPKESSKEEEMLQLVEIEEKKTDAVKQNGNVEEVLSRDVRSEKSADDKKKMKMRMSCEVPPELPPKQLRFDRRAISKQQKKKDDRSDDVKISLPSTPHPGHTSFTQFFYEDKIRSRSQIDEPLAPIQEEELLGGSSSSSEDTLSVKTESLNLTNETWSPASSHHTFTDEDSIRTLPSLEEIRSESSMIRSKVMFCLDEERRSVDSKTSCLTPKDHLDVTPYGMVDLMKFQPTEDVDELTPNSILSSVHDFNSTLSRKTSLKKQNLEDEVPSFPLKIDNKRSDWKVKSRAKYPDVVDENVGYDNLEKYKEIESKDIKIKPEIAKATKSQQSNRLSRHSSAVTALDRHSNHLKRNESLKSDQIKVREVKRSLSSRSSSEDIPKDSKSEKRILKIDEEDKKSTKIQSEEEIGIKKIEDSEEEIHLTPKSLGTQLRNFLSGNSDNKYISPSLRRKRSLLKRSKSPGGSRRSQTPPRSLDKEARIKKKEEKKILNVKEEEKIQKERSVSQRGRNKRSSFRRSEGDLEEKKISEEKKKKSKWRRSKSQDRSSPKCNKKQLERSKSTERTMLKTPDDLSEDQSRGRSRGNIFKRSRSSSRKREGRGKSSERRDERGRNPVSFIRKLLKKRDSDDEEEIEADVIIQVPLGETKSRSESTEALSAILAYKSEDIKPEKGSWTPPRPSPALQRAINAPPRKPSPKFSSNFKDSNSSTSTSFYEGIFMKTSKNLSKISGESNKSFNNSAKLSDTKEKKQNLQKLIQKRTMVSRDYDSDTSIFVKNKNSSLKKSLNSVNQIKEKAPRRPVRLISPKVSKSSPCLFDFSTESVGHTYYNIDEDGTQKTDKIENNQVKNDENSSDQICLLEKQRRKYKMIVSLNNQTLKQVSERYLVEWKNRLPVGGFLITSWSDIALTSHQPICMINKSVIYGAVSNGNNKFNLACQLYENKKDFLQKIQTFVNIPPHPNICGVCSHFVCRVPRSLVDPSGGGGAADVICIVLSNRPNQLIEENLNQFRNDATEFHRQLLLTTLQILQGIKHLLHLSLPLPDIRAEYIITSADIGFVQILPHISILETFYKQKKNSENFEDFKNQEKTQQISDLIKHLLQKASENRSVRNSITSKVVVPGTKYSSAIKQTIQFLQNVPTTLESLQEAAEVIQCALWGPEDLEDASNLSKLDLLDLWLELEQAKLVNSLAVMVPGQQLVLASLLKYRFLTSATSKVLFNSLKILQRI